MATAANNFLFYSTQKVSTGTEYKVQYHLIYICTSVLKEKSKYHVLVPTRVIPQNQSRSVLDGSRSVFKHYSYT